MTLEIELREFEWYLRDLFFRANANNSQKFIDSFKKEDIVYTLLKNYLRYRNYEYEKISNLLNTVLTDLHSNSVLMFDKEIDNIKLYSRFDRNNAKNVTISITCLKMRIFNVVDAVQSKCRNSRQEKDRKNY